MNVLITYGWCRTAYSVAMSLARAGHTVSACSSARLAMTRFSRFASSFDLVPDFFVDEKGYVAALAEIARRRSIDVIMPVHEDALAIQAHRELLPADVRLACPEADQLALALDKGRLLTAAHAHGVPIPRTIVPQSIDEARGAFESIGFPLIIKPRHGNSGKGVVIARNLAQAKKNYQALVTQLSANYDGLPLIQSYVAGELVGSAFLADRGQVVACFTEKYTRCKQAGFGTSVLREPYDRQDLRALTARLAAGLGWHGVGHLDFILPSDGSPLLIEMNPRFWGALQMAVLNGYDFPLALLEQTLYGEVRSRCFIPADKPSCCLWIAGEAIACVEELRNRQWSSPIRSMLRVFSPRVLGSFDDFRWDDPIPLLTELFYYGAGFISSGGNSNPVTPGMLK